MISLAPAVVALLAAGPAFLAVCEVSHQRPFAAFPARWCAAGAAVLCASCTAAQLLWMGAAGTVNFVLLAPPVVGVAPWAAGELCSGPSPRQDLSFAAALGAAYAAALLAEWACGWAMAAAFASAGAATVAYLTIRDCP